MDLISFNNVTFSYNSKQESALKNVSFKIKGGEKVALLGLNGAGKSTLMLLTNGLLLPSSGEIKVKEIATSSKQYKEIRKIVGLVFQNSDDQLFMPTVKEDVAFGPRNMGLTEEEVDMRVAKALEITKIKDLAHKVPFELSGGQKKAASIATVLSMEPELLIMDEPTSGLDYEARNNFISIIETLFSDREKEESNPSLLISTHDLELAHRLCERAIILNKGEIVYDGPINKAPYPHS